MKDGRQASSIVQLMNTQHTASGASVGFNFTLLACEYDPVGDCRRGMRARLGATLAVFTEKIKRISFIAAQSGVFPIVSSGEFGTTLSRTEFRRATNFCNSNIENPFGFLSIKSSVNDFKTFVQSSA